jgi:predicted dehydrogenase
MKPMEEQQLDAPSFPLRPVPLGRRVRVGLIGCGDVTVRRYLPGLAVLAEEVEVVACCDPDVRRAEDVASRCAGWSPRPKTFVDLDALIREGGLDAALNLTPAPLHFEVNSAILKGRIHVYSEKPVAATVAQAQTLKREARAHGLLLLCAPAVVTSERFRWIRRFLDEGRLGRPTLATAQIGDMGPAAWRAYSGDPAPFYRRGVGTLFDQGVYLLHAVTGLLGAGRRVQALGGISIPTRSVRAPARAGERVRVEAEDQMLLHLELEGGTFAQVLSSFAVPATKAPTLEIHGTEGTLSLNNHLSARGPISLYRFDDSPLACDGWIEGVAPWPTEDSPDDVVALGPRHLIACLRGREESLLTPEHASHVLEIAQAAERSVETGKTISLETTF